MPEIIFAVNDPIKGPQVLLYETTFGDGDQALKLKVPIKAQLTLSLTDADSSIAVTEAVLPFPDHQKISFTKLFTIHSESGSVTASISYLVPQVEHFTLYKKIPELKETLNDITNQMTSWVYKPHSSLPKNLFELITKKLLYENELEKKSIELPIVITKEKSNFGPDFLLNKISKNLDQLFFDLYIGKQVIVIGKSKIAVEYAFSTLDLFSAGRNLRKIMFSEHFIDPSEYLNKIDVIGVSSVHEKKYKNYLIVDVDEFKIKNFKGKKEYFSKFIDDLTIVPLSNKAEKIKSFTNQLDKLCEQLEKLIQQSYSSVDSLKEFLHNLNGEVKDILIEIDIAKHHTALFWKNLFK